MVTCGKNAGFFRQIRAHADADVSFQQAMKLDAK
jgi:hypothetical protein